MILWSQQHHIVSSISLSFQNLKKIHTKVSNSILERDKMFLNPSKYELYMLSDFKFIVIWTVFKNSTGQIDTLKLLQQYTKDEINAILKQKEKIVLYENTFAADIITANTKIIIPKNVIQMTKQDILSPLYCYWYFQKHQAEGRISSRIVQRTDLFMDYFPKIQTHLQTV